MTLIGKLVKSALALNQKIDFKNASDSEAQVAALRGLLKTARDTAFGKYYGFEQILEAEDVVAAFRKSVPLHTYEQMHDNWWHKRIELPDITWPGKPEFFAMSSGTTGKVSKRIPITDEFLDSMKHSGKAVVKALPNFDFPESLFESEILMLSSSANLVRHAGGHLEGEISGINVSNFPGWYDLFYRPGIEIAAISDWDERLKRIVAEAPEWNIGAIAGIPSWVLLMLQAIVKEHNLKSIHDIWPNFSVFASGGVAFETYREDFDTICGKPIHIMDTYLASEGFFAYTERPERMNMRLVLDNQYFYEFIPFDERGVNEQGELLENPEIHSIDQVIENQDYVLVVSTCAGAWRYIIGDTIRFTKLAPPEIKITGRTKFFLNVVGSQLSEEKMDTAIVEVSQAMNVTVNEYMVAAVRNAQKEYIHHWVLVSEDELDTDIFAERLDESLKQANKNYAVARSKALKGIEVQAISKLEYHNYLSQNKKKGGQVKTPKVMTAEKMEELRGALQPS